MLSSIPVLHSLPGAERAIFLDFDGHTTTQTSWNIDYPSIHSPAFDVDGDPNSFNADERSRITSIWERMAEDFRPFDVDVTTVDPSTSDPSIFERGGAGQRVVFTTKYDAAEGGTGRRWYKGDGNGVATDSWYRGKDTPVWVFSTHHLAGEIGSHEVGHAIGLGHDSALVDGVWIEYRGEHGTGETRWSPIMGQGNGLSQWSRGEYPGATNRELDIGILTRAFGRREDDFPRITELDVTNGEVLQEGIIETSGDVDTFSLTIHHPSRLQLDIAPWHNGPNLDIAVSLTGPSTGAIVRPNDPQANPVDRLDSSLDVQLTPGIYYLQVQGAGKRGTEADPGYSDYGSLGYYQIRGRLSAQNSSSQHGDFNGDGNVGFADFLILSAHFGQQNATGQQGDMNGDGVIDLTDWRKFAEAYPRRPKG